MNTADFLIISHVPVKFLRLKEPIKKIKINKIKHDG